VATHLDALQVRQLLARTSEAYAVPKRIAVVNEIPMTSTGKYERLEIERILQSKKEAMTGKVSKK
jgi:acyl-coenzyme A synthetase/AMP-(fatty) acid ligase